MVSLPRCSKKSSMIANPCLTGSCQDEAYSVEINEKNLQIPESLWQLRNPS